MLRIGMAVVVGCVVACTGSISEPSAPSPTRNQQARAPGSILSSDGTAISDELAEKCGHAVEPGTVSLHRLNRVEVKNTLRDLTGLEVNAVDDVPADESAAGFDNQASALNPRRVLERLGTSRRLG